MAYEERSGWPWRQQQTGVVNGVNMGGIESPIRPTRAQTRQRGAPLSGGPPATAQRGAVLLARSRWACAGRFHHGVRCYTV
jgi:hypothetical protein